MTVSKKWNDTGIDLIVGYQYSYEATGQWKDGYKPLCDADGYSDVFLDLVFGWKKRSKKAKWFQLIGVVDKDTSYTINLGTKGTFTSPTSGRLWAYANDSNFTYYNNRGSIELNILLG